MKNDRDQDEYADENDENDDSSDDLVDDEFETPDDEPTGDPLTYGTGNTSDWGSFQFDSPELAAYASYLDGSQAADIEDEEAALELVDVDETAMSVDELGNDELHDDGQYDDSEYDDGGYRSENPYELYGSEGFADQLVLDPSLDIDAALAAVGALPDLMAERDAEYEIERQRQQEIARTAEERERWRAGYRFARPPQMRLQRGQPASVIPALILIGVGAYLTFALTLSQTPPAPGMVALLVCAAVGITLLSYWLNARRWARGALFGGLLLILSGAVLYVVTTSSLVAALPAGLAGLTTGGGWRLFLAAAFAALTLSGLLARPVSNGLTVLGLGGLLGIALDVLIRNGSFNGLNLNWSLLLTEGWKIVLPLVVLLIVIGLFQRVRQRRQLPNAELPAA